MHGDGHGRFPEDEAGVAIDTPEPKTGTPGLEEMVEEETGLEETFLTEDWGCDKITGRRALFTALLGREDADGFDFLVGLCLNFKSSCRSSLAVLTLPAFMLKEPIFPII